MTKVSGSYESVVRGVSQQSPQDRLSGQHWDQVNMVSDPVHGLARRHGSVTASEAALPHTFEDLLANTNGHRSFPFSVAGTDYDLLYRSGVRAIETELDDTLFCYNREESVFVPVVLHDTVATQALRHAGVSAIGKVGKFVLMAGNAYTTTWEVVPKYDTPENLARIAVWIRGGAYSRTYTMTLTNRLTGVKTLVTYTTKSSSYPELLDTSDLLTANPDYQKLVNDRVNEYNGLVTEWIGLSAADIVPANIAAKLKVAYDLLGFGPCTVQGSTLMIDDDRWSEVDMADDGDNSLVEAVGNVIEAADGACPVHYAGKVVKVRPSKESPESAYYLEAHPTDGVATGVTEVLWRESCAETVSPERLFVLGVLEGGVLYVSDDIDWLELQVGAETADDIPKYSVSKVGDTLTNPTPYFFGRTIDFIGMIQDRLLIGSGAVITASRPGDYFNFFRGSVLTVKDNDPWEVYSLGSEEDVIKHATTFNRDLILYGQSGQYAISGRAPLTPKTASIVSIAKFEASIDAVPRASGNLVFYCTKRGTDQTSSTALNQIQPAALSDNPESVDVSPGLDDYIQGTAMELVAMTAPNTVLVRTDASRTSLYVYTYLDRADNGQRIMEAWHRWNWSIKVGHLVGMSVSGRGEVLAFVIREAADGTSWMACERLSMSGQKSNLPYMDAMRSYTGAGSLASVADEHLSVAFAGTHAKAYVGSTLPQITANPTPPDYTEAWLGVNMDAYVIPTNPYPRDRNGKAITFGRLTLGPVKVTVERTGGMLVTATRGGISSTRLDFNGFIAGLGSSQPGTQPLVSRTLQAFIGGEVRECQYAIKSKRWLPLTITAIEWAGQIFNRERRA